MGEIERVPERDVYVVDEADQIPVQTNRVGDGADQLLLEDVLRDVVFVPRDVNETPIDADAKPLEQRLGNGDAQRAGDEGVQIETV